MKIEDIVSKKEGLEQWKSLKVFEWKLYIDLIHTQKYVENILSESSLEKALSQSGLKKSSFRGIGN